MYSKYCELTAGLCGIFTSWDVMFDGELKTCVSPKDCLDI
jgi:hypothetical protein